ncbi:hypothetical protein N7532_006021 [Penicillium argentinense]|uniref:Uncharacterized protein n=1 Tax=Penicillium argentinense TaxID=1131581 RepID=A0A9W9FF07_9EURO|nr:uncharacterized protein N7532_006021 [Penicillium argentinense]KAJ5099020.1 hypothetical protein N7532_006021 [Penicillium argentinense]
MKESGGRSGAEWPVCLTSYLPSLPSPPQVALPANYPHQTPTLHRKTPPVVTPSCPPLARSGSSSDSSSQSRRSGLVASVAPRHLVICAAPPRPSYPPPREFSASRPNHRPSRCSRNRPPPFVDRAPKVERLFLRLALPPRPLTSCPLHGLDLRSAPAASETPRAGNSPSLKAALTTAAYSSGTEFVNPGRSNRPWLWVTRILTRQPTLSHLWIRDPPQTFVRLAFLSSSLTASLAPRDLSLIRGYRIRRA